MKEKSKFNVEGYKEKYNKKFSGLQTELNELSNNVSNIKNLEIAEINIRNLILPFVLIFILICGLIALLTIWLTRGI